MAQILYQASAVGNALQEGTMIGVIATIEHQNPGISRKDIKRKIRPILQWSQEKFDYWCEWLLDEPKTKE